MTRKAKFASVCLSGKQSEQIGRCARLNFGLAGEKQLRIVAD
jgi:hypothetical protein